MAVDHYENFPVASILLPARLRGAVTDIYRFARSADDIADEGQATNAVRLAHLGNYRSELHRIGAEHHRFGPAMPELAPIFDPLAATIRQHQLPITAFFDLLSAFEQDVIQTRYSHYKDLLDYASRSANPVGRLMLHLYRAATPENLEQSDAICTGLQLVNMWQDVQIDWRKGRVYLPQEDMDRFGVTESDIDARRLTPRWRALMQFEIQRTRALLHFGAPLARRIPGRAGFELRLVVLGGLRILERIEAARFDVFMNRPILGKADWFTIFWRAAFRYDT
ncbi:MAG: squalene synthase HpnC [Burkholderiaceae bacterium]|nr:squalene synthase HpnC [Burkholderiaceae bacterium]